MQDLDSLSTAKRITRTTSCRSIGGARETLPLMAEQDHLRGDLVRESERSRGSGSVALPLTSDTRRPYVRTFVCPPRARLSVRHWYSVEDPEPGKQICRRRS